MRHRFAQLLLVLLASTALTATDIVHIDLHQPGSSCVVVQPTPQGERVMVIDFGLPARKGQPSLVLDALRRQKLTTGQTINQVDLGIVTHTDRDHVAGIHALLGADDAGLTSGVAMTAAQPRGPPPMPVRTVLSPAYEITTATGRAFVRRVAALGILHLTTTEHDSIGELEAEYGIRIFAAHHPRTTNDSSIVVAVIDTDRRGIHLITGDVTAKSWREVAPQVAALRLPLLSITAPHHGGERALVRMLQDLTTKPVPIVFSADAANPHRHPSVRVLRDLARMNVVTKLRNLERARTIALLQDDGILAYRKAIFMGVYDGLSDQGRSRLRWQYGDFDAPSTQVDTSPFADNADNLRRIGLDMSVRQWENFKRFQTSMEQWDREHRAPTHDTATDAHRELLEATIAQEQVRARAAGLRVRYRDLLITGNRGDIAIARGRAPTPKTTFFDEAAFLYLAHVTDDELKALRTWDRAHAYCLLHVNADLFVLKTLRDRGQRLPAWATEYSIIDPQATTSHLEHLARESARVAATAVTQWSATDRRELIALYRMRVTSRTADYEAMRDSVRATVDARVAWAARRIKTARYDEAVELPRLEFSSFADDLPRTPPLPHSTIHLPPGATKFAAVPPNVDPLRYFDAADDQLRAQRQAQVEARREIRRIEEKARERERERERIEERGRG